MIHKEKLTNAGVDLNTALDRFMNSEVLYEKFLHKFLEDQTFYKLKAHLDNKNIPEAFAAAHILKGLCGNLGFSSLTDIINPINETLRSGQTDGIDERMKLLEVRYQELCSAIKNNS